MKCFGFAGWSGAGKTTLIERLIPLLVGEGLRVSLIKHTHHDFDIDRPGKDSYRFREAGAAEVMLVGERRWALMHEQRPAGEPALEDLLPHLSRCDLVLAEGFKAAEIPKIEVHRPALGKPLLHPAYPNVVALATDGQLASELPCLDLNAVQQVLDFVLRHCGFAVTSARREDSNNRENEC